MARNEESKKKHLRRRFQECKKEGGQQDRKLRRERKKWKRALNKLNRRSVKDELRDMDDRTRGPV